MQPVRRYTRLVQDGEEFAHLVDDRGDDTGLGAVGAPDRVAVQGIAEPEHRTAVVPDRADESGQPVGDHLRAHSRDERQPAGLTARIQPLAEVEQFVGGRGRPHLAADRVDDLGQQSHMGAVELPGAFADPRPVGRAEHPPKVVEPAELRLLVVHQQRLVARPDRALDVASGRTAVRPPTEVPHRLAGGHEAHDHARRIGPAAVRVRLGQVDHVPPVGGEQELPVDLLDWVRARFRELPGDSADPDDRQTGPGAEQVGEAVYETGLGRDVRLAALVRVLGAVTGLEDQCLTVGHQFQRPPECGDLVGTDERLGRRQDIANLGEPARVVPARLLSGAVLPLHICAHHVRTLPRAHTQAGIPARTACGTSIPSEQNCQQGFLNSHCTWVFPSSERKLRMK